MPFALTTLLLAGTLSGPVNPGVMYSRAAAAAPASITLADAVSAAAARESGRVEIRNAAGSPGSRAFKARPRTGRHSAATRVTAIVAGGVLGALAGMLGGLAVDVATSNGECLTGMHVGTPVGGVLGAVFTARLIR